MNTMTRIC